MEKFVLYINESEKRLNLADHMAYKIYPLIKEKTILLKVLTELGHALNHMINAVLNKEYLYKNVTLTQNPQINLETFTRKCASKYGISRQEMQVLLKIVELNNRHVHSPMEFSRGEKVVIMSDNNGNLKTETLDISVIKSFLSTTKTIFKKVKTRLEG